jgi:lipoyl(octanoyl) transferase
VKEPLTAWWLGRRRYVEALELQRRLFEARKADTVSDVVLLLEHAPVVTMGRGSHETHLLASRAELERQGVEVVVTDRGGDVTLHAPGQLVAYPIVRLGEGRRDVRKYVQLLERVMQRLVAPHGVGAGPFAPHIGLWADTSSPAEWPGQEKAQAPAKIGAIGVRISRWTTMHGFALNLSTDLSLFRLIVPCGIHEYPVASVQTLVGVAPDVRSTAEVAHRELAQGLDLEPIRFVDQSGHGALGPELDAELRKFADPPVSPSTIA